MDEPRAIRWEQVLAVSVRLRRLVPDAVLVGGSAAATDAGHGTSLDDDRLIRDLRQRFDEILDAVEATDGWASVGVETGIRQLIRQRPLEVEEVATQVGLVRVPTLREMARIKAWLILQRNATRDFLDFAALADRLGAHAPSTAIEMDGYYVDQRGPGGARIAAQVAKQLAEPVPYDLSEIDLRRYRGLLPRWQEWAEVLTVCRQVAVAVLAEMAESTR